MRHTNKFRVTFNGEGIESKATTSSRTSGTLGISSAQQPKKNVSFNDSYTLNVSAGTVDDSSSTYGDNDYQRQAATRNGGKPILKSSSPQNRVAVDSITGRTIIGFDNANSLASDQTNSNVLITSNSNPTATTVTKSGERCDGYEILVRY